MIRSSYISKKCEQTAIGRSGDHDERTGEIMKSTGIPGDLTPASATEQINNNVSATLTTADATSGNRIQNLNLVHQARVSRLTRSAATASAQYGATSTQATAAQAAVTAAQASAARIELVHQQVTTPAPQVAATGWALHGRVYTAQLQPAAGYTVFLVDSQKIYQSAYGFAYTDSTGYFLINYAGNAATSSDQSAPRAKSAPKAESASKSEATGQTDRATEPIFVEIVNTSANPVYLSSAAFQPSLGNATYQNITLPAGEPVLGDPPEAIRQVALPPTKRPS
jgi:hypothetical protein